MLDVRHDRPHCSVVSKRRQHKLYAFHEDDSEIVEEAADNEEVLQLWCSLEESENEQWQEVISRRNKPKVKKANPTSLLSVENIHDSNSCDRAVCGQPSFSRDTMHSQRHCQCETRRAWNLALRLASSALGQ